ncbi:MAG: glycosyltransferase family 2 protein [Thermoleophilaceae bacterium]|nr:glycosyltransferase family 2 protein [Thermoleophilaceae bacterium]
MAGGAGRRERISAVIACYRDAPAIPIMHERLTAVFRDLGVDYEIVFVNDGSPDDSREVLGELAARDRRVVAITHTRAFGSQSAFTSGMRLATGDAVVLLDGDLQDPPELIPEFVQKWRDGYTVVYGERVDREAHRVMRWAYKLFYRLFRRVSYLEVPVDAGDFGLMDRRAVDALNRLPEKQRFLRGLRAWVGFRQTGVPYRRPERMFGRSTNSPLKNLGWARRAIVSFSYAPLDFIMVVALVVVGASFAALLAQIVLKLALPTAAPRGITTLVVLVLFIGGVQLLCLSIIGSYLAHMYDEVKARPAYVVDEILNAPPERWAEADESDRGAVRAARRRPGSVS